MKSFVCSMACFLMILPAAVSAQCKPSLHLIGLGETEWWQCWGYEPSGGGIMTVIVFHHGFAEMGAAQFRLVSGGGFTGQYIGETLLGGISWGNSQDGITIWRMCEGGIYPGEKMLLEVQYMTDGTSPPCSYVTVGGHPGIEGQVEPGLFVWDCVHDDECFEAGEGIVLVNPNMGGVHCDLPCIIPVHETTWGRIKELYGK